jgi:crossover junction endodeoxyribonuclease RuvC
MTTIIGVDPSLSATGLARWHDGHIVVTTVSTPVGELSAARHHTIVMRILGMRGTNTIKPATLVVIESPILPRGEDVKNRQVPLDLFALRAVIYHGLYSYGIPWVEVHPSTLKLYATGNGRASKADMLTAARGRLGKHLFAADHNEADAAWLMAMGVGQYVEPLCPLPQTNRKAMATPKWPRQFHRAIRDDNRTETS